METYVKIYCFFEPDGNRARAAMAGLKYVGLMKLVLDSV